MRFIVTPVQPFTGEWRWELIDTETGEVHATGKAGMPAEARAEAKRYRDRVYMAPIEMGN